MISLIKGKVKSILIDFEEKIIKSIDNTYVPDMSNEEDSTELIKPIPHLNKCDFDILDINLRDKNNDLSNIFKNIITNHNTFYNIKIICFRNNLSYKYIEKLISFLNENIYHFGIIFTANSTKLLNFVEDKFPYIKIFKPKKTKVKKENSLSDPKFFPIYDVYKISDVNNAYHYKRMTLIIKSDNFLIVNHNKYNISKNKIKVCKDCEYRRICFDERVPVKINNNEYIYEKKCSYNPHTGKWNT